MSQTYKVCVKNFYGGPTVRMIGVKPSLATFESLKEEMYHRFPDMKGKNFELYYEDADFDKISIVHTKDFELFQQRKIDKIFVVVGTNVLSFFVKNNDATALLPSQRSASIPTVNIGSMVLKVAGQHSQLQGKQITGKGKQTNVDANNGDVVDSSVSSVATSLTATSGDPPAKKRRVTSGMASRRPTRILKPVLVVKEPFTP